MKKYCILWRTNNRNEFKELVELNSEEEVHNYIRKRCAPTVGGIFFKNKSSEIFFAPSSHITSVLVTEPPSYVIPTNERYKTFI